jgi:hypothetical protein
VTHERVITRDHSLSQFVRTLLPLSVDCIKLMTLVHNRSITPYLLLTTAQGQRRAKDLRRKKHDESRLNPNRRSVSRGAHDNYGLCVIALLKKAISPFPIFPLFFWFSLSGIGFPVNEPIVIHSTISFLRFLLPVGLNKGQHYPRYTPYSVHSTTMSFPALLSEYSVQSQNRILASKN